MLTVAPAPIRLAPNVLRRGYRGGEAIAAFRGMPAAPGPEDWVGSTASVAGEPGLGVSRVGDRPLDELLRSRPDTFFSPAHLERYGPEPELLVKLLDAGQRLMVHYHPDRRFAGRRLGLTHGKTEAWIVVGTRGDDPAVWLGFRHDVSKPTVLDWIERQDAGAMLGALNRIPVRPGDALYVPGGVPHAIGEGLLIVELQEPSDLSVWLEFEGFNVDGRRDGHLGLGFEAALDSLDHSRHGPDDLVCQPRAVRPGVFDLLPPDASSYFRAERLTPANGGAEVEADFSIVVVTGGEGTLVTERGGQLAVRRGDTLLVPYAAGSARLEGAAEAIRCRPPAV